MLCFTLWYGGQSFSLRDEELETELAIGHNLEMKQALKDLLADSVFSEKATGLLVMNPRLKRNVDAATLFLISFGANLGSQLPVKRGYYTIQSGFVNYSRVRHHPMVYLAENVRSYVSDYCQRIFGRLFSLLSKKGYEQDYSIMRRFVMRLSLFSSLRFAVSGEEKIKAIIDKLESLGAMTLISDQAGEMYIFLKGDLMT